MMQKIDLTIFESITKLNQESQNKLLRLFVKVDITTKLKILKLQKQIFHKLKSEHRSQDNALLTLSSLILAIDAVVQKTDEASLNVIKLRSKNKKTKIKRQKVLGYWAVVRKLRLEEQMSFRDISSYLVKFHKFEVSYSTIYEMWNTIEVKQGE